MPLLVRKEVIEIKSLSCSVIGHFDNIPVGLVCSNNVEGVQMSNMSV